MFVYDLYLDSADVIVVELVLDVAQDEAGFTDASLAQQNDFVVFHGAVGRRCHFMCLLVRKQNRIKMHFYNQLCLGNFVGVTGGGNIGKMLLDLFVNKQNVKLPGKYVLQ